MFSALLRLYCEQTLVEEAHVKPKPLSLNLHYGPTGNKGSSIYHHVT
jgi:hypothetical protein